MSSQLNSTVKIVTQRMSSIVQRKTIPQGFLDERGTQWNRKRARFNSESGRKRIGILIQPESGLFSRSQLSVRFSFIQVRILSMLSQREFIPAVSFIPLSTLEKTMTQDLFLQFWNGWTENESIITSLIGDSILGIPNTINSVKESLVWQALSVPLLVLGGNTFQIIPTQTGTNKIDLIQPDTLTREFSTSEPCSYSNAILRFSNSGERFSVTLQVLGTIKRIE